MTKDGWADLGGWTGIALIQGASLPSMIAVFMGWSENLPPASMVCMIWIGLALFLYRSYVRKDHLAVVSNGLGAILQTIMMAIIFLRG